MSDTSHNRILGSITRDAFKPLGLIQKGRSRVWLDDHGWWVCMVDFEPLSWQKGTRLVVAADFLWHDRNWLAYSVGGRLRDEHNQEVQVEFKDEAQWRRDIQSLAQRAIEEILLYRSHFQSAADWAGELSRPEDSNFWRAFDAGLAYALAGNQTEAERWLKCVCASTDDRDWALAAKERAERLRCLLDEPHVFNEELVGTIKHFRSNLHLPEVDVLEQLERETNPIR
jgi:hypothetical protein